MKNVIETDRFAIYDDVLPNDKFPVMWNYAEQENYSQPHQQGWKKVWRLNDGEPFGTKLYYHTDAPFNMPMDNFHAICLDMAEKHPDLLGEWDEISMRTYLYPRGAKLSWHNDTGYEGVVIYYIHPYWGSTWGGELFVANTPKGGPGLAHLDHRQEDYFLSEIGCGHYVTSKPNRAVIQSPNVWHQVNRIDDDAGDHIRAAMIGFFRKGREDMPYS